MEFGQKIFLEIDLFDFTSFFAWTFLNFLARCEAEYILVKSTYFFVNFIPKKHMQIYFNKYICDSNSETKSFLLTVIYHFGVENMHFYGKYMSHNLKYCNTQ